MAEITTIAKQPVRLPSKDYEFLRKEGLKHIESLAHDLWTDYNSHDPGITILEALCYAITELGYRCGFDMKDLVVTEGSGITDKERLFFTAKEILTNNPLTINDYRKLLVDIEGVHNAWLLAANTRQDDSKKDMPVNEVPLYADFKNDKLTSEEKPTALFLSGLYQVLLDLEYDDLYGDLNTGDIVLPNPLVTGFTAGEFMLSFELPPLENSALLFAEKATSISPDPITNITVTPDEPPWTGKVVLDDTSSLEFTITIPKKPGGKKINGTDIATMLGNGFMQKVFQQYLEKLKKVKNILQVIIKKLQGKRNLCEDFLSVKTINSEEISFCFDIDVLPSVDIEKVQTETFFAIENYLNPPVEFYSLRELLDKKIAVDEIFNGPVLEHGFISNEQLEQTGLRTVIHTSDIINLLMDIEGVLAIRNFVMTKHGEDGKPIPGQTGLTWCMHISPLHKPVLAEVRSKIILFKNQFPFLAHYDEVRDTILLLHAERAKDKLNGFQQDIPVPAGNKRDTESFWPVQYDLPQTYGVGLYGLPANATVQRMAQQKQLKSYFMFYEQLLADFFSQFTNAHKLFSVADITNTYHAQFLGEIKDIDSAYKMEGGTVLLEEAINNADSNKKEKNRWQSLYENRQIFQDRHDRFLDHLLARFAESFNDYALLMYSINYEERTEERISFDELTKAKIKTLRDYPGISSERAKAFNYYPQDTDNFSGLEKRICSLTGINDPVGLRLVEHILLRPRPINTTEKFSLMEVCLHHGECPCEIDPYTFRASVVLPCWPGHFDNLAFREYFESKIREEAPAHLMLKICWLSNDLMREFEVCYKKWIETLATYTEDKDRPGIAIAFKEANDEMIELLSKLHSEYPQATLHDCDESKEGSNTVVLGKTVLGRSLNK